MRKLFLALGMSAIALTSLASCDLDSVLGSDEQCVQYEQMYQTDIKEEGRLLDHINTDGDFSMAMTINASGLQKLFDAANEWSYSSFGIGVPSIGIGGCTGANLLYDYPGSIDNCLSFTIPVNIASFKASATFGIPITDEIKGDKTSIYINLKKAEILDLQANGKHLDTIASKLIETGIHAWLDSDLPKVHLFDIQAWEIGDNNVKMYAGAPRMNFNSKTVTFGMYSNIFFSQTASVTWDQNMPQDAEIGLHIHPDLIRGLLSRMLNEGHISDNVVLSEDGSAPTNDLNSDRGFKVSMANIARDYPQDMLLEYSSDWANYFTFAFRLWSTDTFCGYMDVLAGLHLSITDSKFEIGLGNVHMGKSSGWMTLTALTGEALISTPFFQEVLNYANLSFNFNEFSVSTDKGKSDGMRKAQMGADHIQFDIDGNGISLFLNFLDL